MQITSWKNKRILITGSSGFIGRHLMQYFRIRGANILGLSRRELVGRDEKCVDLLKYNDVYQHIKRFKPDVLFHLASKALVETGQDNPLDTYENNTLGALHILEASRRVQVKKIIIASTVHVYGDAPLPYKEVEPARPSRPYETSKTVVDLIAQSYADTYDLPVLIPRFVNIYGPGDHNLTRIIPKTINAILRQKTITQWGGDTQRDYLYIDDALRAYEMLAHLPFSKVSRNRIFNIGTGKTVKSGELIELLLRLSGVSARIKRIKPTRNKEISIHQMDTTKARIILKWSPHVDLETGLAYTLQWYRDHYAMFPFK